MAASDDWVRFALELPMREMPGARFEYCSPGFHVLSALVSANLASGVVPLRIGIARTAAGRARVVRHRERHQ